MKRVLLTSCLILLLTPPVMAQVNGGTAVYTFTPNTIISSSEVNANFSRLFSDALDRTGGTLTGTLNSRAILPTADNTYDIGSPTFRFKDLYITGTLGTTSGQITATSTTTPQITAAYDGSNYMGISVASNGATTLNATGGSAAFTFVDNSLFSGTVTVSGALAASTTFTATGAADFSAVINANSAGTGLAVDNNATVGGTLQVTGTTTVGVVNATGAVNLQAAGTGLDVDNNVNIDGTVQVDGTSNFSGVASFVAGLTLTTGPFKLTYTSFATTPFTALTTHVFLVNKTSGAAQLDLYSCTGSSSGNVLIVHNDSASTLTIDAAGSETIDGGATDSLLTQTGTILICDGVSEWHSIIS